jgi:hypothetical protein
MTIIEGRAGLWAAVLVGDAHGWRIDATHP